MSISQWITPTSYPLTQPLLKQQSLLCAPLGSPLGSREIAVESGAHRLGPRDGNGPNGHENRPEDYPLVI